MAKDVLGNEVTGAEAETLSGINDFVSGYLGFEKRAVNILAAADSQPDCMLAQLYAGMIWMFLETPDAPGFAAPFFERARAQAHTATRREHMTLELLEQWSRGEMDAAWKTGDQMVEEFPTDLVVVKLRQGFSFDRGDAPGMLRIARMAEPANPQNPHLHAMLAFGYEQCHLLDNAEASARRALEIESREPWAQHALAHVMLGQGRVREGEQFLGEMSAGWGQLNSFMYTHNWWHRALFQISLGDFDSVFKAYDAHVWAVDKDYSEDQIGAVSLLARMECAGMDVGNRWEELAEHLGMRAKDTVSAFKSVQYLYGLAKAERSEANELMAAIEDRAATAQGFDRREWGEVGLPAAKGVLAHARGQWLEAIGHLQLAGPRMAEIGGSHAQRDLFGQLLLDAHYRAGNLVQAQQMMEHRRGFDPDGVPLNRMLADVYLRLGLDAEAQIARGRHYS